MNINAIIKAFIRWYSKDSHKENENAYPELKNSEYLTNLNKTEFIDFFFQFVNDGGQIQSGGHRTAGKFKEFIEGKYESFREFVLKPYQSNFNIDDWLEQVSEFNYFGWGASTIYLNRIDKNRFAIVNNKSQNALKALGYEIKGDLINNYRCIETAQKDLLAKYPKLENFYVADSLTHFLIGTKEGRVFIPDPVLDLIERYKKIKRKNGHTDEMFKYEAVQHFQNNWDANVSDFSGMLKNALSKQINLIYNLAHGTILHLARKKPEEIRELFKYLFDENIEVMERIKTFDSETDKLFKTIEPTSNGFQDERTVSIYLTFKYPEKYTFFKDSFYTKFCQFLGEKKARKGKKYIHYLSLIQNFKEKYVLNDDELWQLTNATLPENAWPDKECNILAQDILFVCFDHYPEPNYWVFQGNPKHYDIVGSLRDNILETWTVAAHKNKIKAGDKIILWVTGENSGCYALCIVKSEITKRKDKSSEQKYYTQQREDISKDRVEITLEHNLWDRPCTKDKLFELPEFLDFKGGNQGTNFVATKEQYNIILSIIQNQNRMKKYWIYAPGENAHKWDEFYKDGIMGLGWEALGDLNKYGSKDEIVAELQKIENTISSKKNDATANYEFRNTVSIGDVIFVKKGIRELLGYGIVTSDYFYDEIREHYQKLRKVDWKKKGSWKTDFNLPLKTLTDVTKYPSEYPNFEFYYERLLSIIENGEEPKNKMNHLQIPQNLILYGPPGTGKTYRLINDYVHLFTNKTDEKTKELFSYELVSELKWWEVIAICMYELGKGKVNDLVQHSLMLEKISQSDNSKPRNTIWYWLQNHTKQDCPNVNVAKRHDVQIFWKDENSIWSIDKKLTEEMLPDLIEKLLSWKNYKPENKETKRYEMITFHQSYGYEEFIEGIRPDFQEEEDLKYNIEQGIFIRIAEKARKDKDNPYAIFIDEINRGNISKIFGELITLIEPDKRQGKENELEVTLPYSKTKFSVPPNLYIIGTMNTADRSIALIDTALRRRFHFKEMMPDSKLLNDNIEEINMQFLLDKINERIEFLLDRDHTIGHSYLMKVKSKNDICRVFKNKIIPLLQEYFYNDWEKIQLVLGDNKSWGKNKDKKLVQLKKYYSVEEEKKLFGYDVEEYEDEKIYEINSALRDNRFDEIGVESFIHIYQKPIKIVQT